MGNLKRVSGLTDQEIEAKYGWFIRTALDAFESDSTYLADMVEQARLITWRQELLAARKIAQQQGGTPEEVRAAAHEALAERGIHPPARVSRPRAHSVA